MGAGVSRNEYDHYIHRQLLNLNVRSIEDQRQLLTRILDIARESEEFCESGKCWISLSENGDLIIHDTVPYLVERNRWLTIRREFFVAVQQLLNNNHTARQDKNGDLVVQSNSDNWSVVLNGQIPDFLTDFRTDLHGQTFNRTELPNSDHATFLQSSFNQHKELILERTTYERRETKSLGFAAVCALEKQARARSSTSVRKHLARV